LVPKLQRVKGVGQVNVLEPKIILRIWINPEKWLLVLSQRYSAAWKEQNVEAAQENLEKMQTVF
jgi:multidrug efflux pump subunit AcrB